MRFLMMLSFMILSGSAWAQKPTYEEVITGVKKDLAEASSRLSTQREGQTESKVKLAGELAQVRSELAQKRRLSTLARMSHADRALMLKGLKAEAELSEREVDLLNQMLLTYGFHFSAKLFPGETYDEQLDSIFQKEGDASELLEQRLGVLDAGVARLENMLGGAVIQGEATDDQAQVHQGKVAIFGPLQWFQSEDGKVSGAIQLSKSGRVAALDVTAAEQANALVAGKEANCLLDLTGGKAAAFEAVEDSWGQLIKKGGAWVYPILGIALIALLCALFKALQLATLKEPKSSWLRKLVELREGGSEEALMEYVKSTKHPIAEVIRPCLESASCGAEVVEEILYEQLIDVREKLRKWLPFIAITAATAPLLGLLGTVSGLIKTFNVITVEGTGEAQTFAGGISEALVTTMFGLMVAIPAFILHALLSRKSRGIEQMTEKLGLGFVNALRKNQG